MRNGVSQKEMELRDICKLREDRMYMRRTERSKIISFMCRDIQGRYPDIDLDDPEVRFDISDRFDEDILMTDRIFMYDRLKDSIDALDAKIEASAPNTRDIEVLESIPGMDPISAIELSIIISDIGRFSTPETFCSFFNMAPNSRGDDSKQSESVIKPIISRVTDEHLRLCSSTIGDYYDSHVDRMGVAKTVVACQRKMMMLIHIMLTDGRMYQPR